jgi:hypothetical protein
MKKKEYLQPTMDVVEIDMNAQILAGSVTSVTTTGLGDDNLELPSGDDPISGVLNDAAW